MVVVNPNDLLGGPYRRAPTCTVSRLTWKSMAMGAVLPGRFGKPGSGVLRAADSPRRAHGRNV